MEKKTTINKKVNDYEAFENPADDLNEIKSNPDKWVAPEMLRQIGESSYNNLDNSLINE